MTSFCRFLFLQFGSLFSLPLPPHLPKYKEEHHQRRDAHDYRHDYKDRWHSTTLSVEPIPHRSDRLDILWLLRIILKYLPKFQYEIINRPIGRIDMVPPYCVQ